MISTTLVTFNRLDYTKLTIESYIQTTKVPHELIVVDNHSSDGTRKYLKGVKEIDHLILNDDNFYPAYATNQGWSASNPKATHLHRSDNDLLYRPGWDELVLKAFDKVPKLGQLGLINELYQMKPSLHKDWLAHLGIEVQKFGKLQLMEPPNAQHTTGGPCVVPAHIFRNGLHWPQDEWIGKYNEDAKYSDLIRQEGYEVLELVNEKVRHIGFGDIQKYMDYYLSTYERREWFPFFTERLRLERTGQIKNKKVID